MYYEGEDQAYGDFDNLGNNISFKGHGGNHKQWRLGPSGPPKPNYDPSAQQRQIPRKEIPFSGNLTETQARAFGQERSRLAREKRGPWAPRAGMTVATGQALTASRKSRFTEGPAKRIRQETENDLGLRKKGRGLRGIWLALTKGRGRKRGLKLVAQQRIEDDGVSVPGDRLRFGLPKLFRKPRRGYMDKEVPGIVRPLGPGRGMMDVRAEVFADEVERGPGVAIRRPFGRGVFGQWLQRLFGRRQRVVDSGVKPLGPVDNLYGWEFEPGSKSFTRWPSEPETFTTEYKGSYSNL